MTTALEAILNALDTDPDRPRVENRGRAFSGADLRGRIGARAADLQSAGVKQDDRILIIVSDNLSAIEQLIACWILGASAVLVDFRAPSSRIEEWRQRIAPQLVLGLRTVPGQHVHRQARDPDPAMPDLEKFSYQSHAPGRLALCVSSSGTTGLPKLTDVTQDRLAWILTLLNDDPRTLRQGTFLSAMSVGFSASCYVWLRLLLSGRPILALDLIYRLSELDTGLKRTDVLETVLAPGAIRQLAALPWDGTRRYPQLQRLACVGGPARPQDKLAAVTRLSDAYIMNYSCIGVGMIARITAPEVLQRPASCGRPEPGVTLEIRNEGRLCSPGEIGEIFVSTARLSDHRPGDLGWLDEAGYLYVTGRVQGLLSRNGVNFNAERLVAAALACPDVLEAGVATLRDSDDGDAVHLVVQAATTATERVRNTLGTLLRQTLAAAEYPDKIHVWTDMPLTAGGKVDSRMLAERLAERLAETLAQHTESAP
ncbi:class I adenylate-forming enzyme family protein [Cypionkella sinensis]|uniref:class I adenylate-forming enzyme family protein n=1 Tax=Cypionkella sinensis TaxID=1756043 RepID=UPI003641C207